MDENLSKKAPLNYCLFAKSKHRWYSYSCNDSNDFIHTVLTLTYLSACWHISVSQCINGYLLLCMSERAICQILVLSLQLQIQGQVPVLWHVAGVIARLLHDHRCKYIILALQSVPYGIAVPLNLYCIVQYICCNDQHYMTVWCDVTLYQRYMLVLVTGYPCI